MKKLKSLLLPVLCLVAFNAEAATETKVQSTTPTTDKNALTYPASGVEMTLKKVSKHVYYVQGISGIATDNEGFISNASAIITDKAIAIVDALGSPSLAEKFLVEIRKVSDAPITHMIVTHYHADHIYGLQVFKDLGATIVAPLGTGDYLQSENAEQRLEERRFSLEPWVNENTRLVSPDEIMENSKTITLGEVEITLNYLGKAHSEGDMSVYVAPDKVLISGDVIFEGRTPFVGDANTKIWMQALDSMRKQNMQGLIPGHGPAASDPVKAISLTYDYLAHLRSTLGNAVENLVPFSEAYEEIEWSQFEDLPAFAEANRRNAYQVYLSMEAESLE